MKLLMKLLKRFALAPRSPERLELTRRGGRRRAMILVLVLWIITVMTVLAASLAFDVQINSKLALIQREQFIAYQLARAAVAEGITHLQNDLLLDYAENQNQMFDSFADVWAQPHRKEKDREVELGRGTYELDVFDEEGKIPINYASMKLYQAMLEFYGYEGEDALDVAQAILDFRDGDDIAGSTGEKENEYYSALVDDTFNPDRPPEVLPYQTTNELFLSNEQLLDVYGITPELYYGYDPEEAEEKELRLRNNVVLGKAARPERASRRRRNQVLPLKDIVTVYPTGNRVNVNTAPAEVLTILFHAASNFADITAAATAAEAIVKHRGDLASGRGSRRRDDDDAFKTEADLLQVPGIDPNLVAQLRNAGALGVTLGFKSDTYRIVGIGRMGRVQRTIEVVVRRNLDVYNPEDPKLAEIRKANGQRAPRLPRRRPGDKSKDNLIREPAIRVVQWFE